MRTGSSLRFRSAPLLAAWLLLSVAAAAPAADLDTLFAPQEAMSALPADVAAAAVCDGIGDGTWNGCRGTGCHVCQEKLAGYPCYFQNHPGCVLNTTCAGLFYDCDAACPAPTAADRCTTCDGSGDGTWNGCRGTGCHVCQEKLAGYDCYFLNHPNCNLNTTCAGLFYDCDAACPAPTAADRCAAGADLDGDGIADSYEATLMRRFAPLVRLHPSDAYRPSSAEWYLSRTHMRFHHSDCSDCQILDKGTVTFQNVYTQSHRNKSGWPWCSHSGSWEYSDLRTSSSRFFLQIPNDSAEMTTRLGSTSADWTCYAHVRRAPGSSYEYDIQYWFFYPYNGDLGGIAGAHEGDWEHVTVRVWNDGVTLDEMYFSAHDQEGQWYWPWQLTYSGGRPVAYSAYHSHASYPWAGSWGRGLLPSDSTADGGPVMDCLSHVANVGERNRPLSGKTWMQYSGRWGEIGAFGGSCILCFSGPWTPVLQGYWDGD